MRHATNATSGLTFLAPSVRNAALRRRSSEPPSRSIAQIHPSPAHLADDRAGSGPASTGVSAVRPAAPLVEFWLGTRRLQVVQAAQALSRCSDAPNPAGSGDPCRRSPPPSGDPPRRAPWQEPASAAPLNHPSPGRPPLESFAAVKSARMNPNRPTHRCCSSFVEQTSSQSFPDLGHPKEHSKARSSLGVLSDGSSRPNWAARVTSAYPPSAEVQRTSWHFAFVPNADISLRRSDADIS